MNLFEESICFYDKIIEFGTLGSIDQVFKYILYGIYYERIFFLCFLYKGNPKIEIGTLISMKINKSDKLETTGVVADLNDDDTCDS